MRPLGTTWTGSLGIKSGMDVFHSNGVSAHGTIVSMQPTPGAAFVDIGEIAGDVAVPSLSRNPIEMTTHNDDIDAYSLGVLRRGESTFPINFVKANTSHNITAGLFKLIADNIRTGFRITFPDTSVWIFSGGVSNVGMRAPVDGVLQADISIRPSGPMMIDGVTIS